MSKGWDNTALKKLKALMGKGLSTAEIGKRLGMSKNAVVGKLNRLGWNAKAGLNTSAKTTSARSTKKTVAQTTKAKANAKVAPKKTGSVGVIKKIAAKVSGKKTVTEKPTKSKPVVKVKEPVATKTPRASSRTSEKNLAIHQRIIQHSLEMANLKPNQCRWPIGDPDSEDFHFCGKTVFTGKPYCYEHCRLAYQFAPPKKKQ